MSIHAFIAILSLALSSSALASSVSSSAAQGSDGNGNPTTVVTITVTPGTNESIRDFHIYPSAPKSKLPGSAEYDQPTDWGTPTGGGTTASGKHWKVPSNKPALSGPSTFTITVPGAPTTQTWSYYSWTTSSDSSSTCPAPNASGWVDNGATGLGGGQIPVAAFRMLGPDSVTIGETGTFLVDGGYADDAALEYTVYASLSLDPDDSAQVNLADMLPTAWEVGISTNSRSGTTTVGPGVWRAVYYSDSRNHVLVDVPSNLDLVGRTIYLQVEFADGDRTTPVSFTITS